MPTLTISEAARVCGCDRRTLQRAVQAGRLRLTPDHHLDTADLRRAGYAVPVAQLDTAPAPQDAAAAPQAARHAAVPPHVDATMVPQALALATALAMRLEALTSTIEALHHEVVLLREELRQTTRRRRSLAPPLDAAPVPQIMPHAVRHAAEAPQAAPAPAEGATPPPVADPTPHLQRIAAVAAEAPTLSLAELAQLLYDRGIYRAKERKTGVAKPVNRGTLTRWLEQARAAGLL